MGRLMTKAVSLLENVSVPLGARTIGLLFIDFVAAEQQQQIAEQARKGPIVWERNWPLITPCRQHRMRIAPDADIS